MTAILVHYLLFVSFHYLIVNKFKIQDLAMKQTKLKFIYLLGKCDFCFGFWIAVLTTLVVDVICMEMNIQDFIMPFEIMGIWIILKGLENE